MDSLFISQLNIENIFSINKHGGKEVKNLITQKERKELMTKMAMIFAERIQELSTELQEILIDDMVTALENRLKVLIRIQEKSYA